MREHIRRFGQYVPDMNVKALAMYVVEKAKPCGFAMRYSGPRRSD